MAVEGSKKQRTAHRVKTWKVVVGLALLLPIVAVQWLLYSSYFVRLVVDRVMTAVPQLDIDNISGSIGGGLRLDAVYDDGLNTYEVSDLTIDVAISCIFRLHVCVKNLSIDTVEVILTTPENKSNDKATIELPSVTLPVSVSIDSLSVNSLRIINKDSTIYTLEKIQTALEFDDSELEIDNFQASDAYCQWQFSGTVTLRENYPVQSTVGCQSVSGFGNVQLTLSQSVQHLRATGALSPQHQHLQSGGEVLVDYTIKPLQPDLPMTLVASLPQTTVLQLNADTITIDALQLTASSENLAAEIEWQGEAAVSRWPGTHTINGNAFINPEHLQLHSLAWQLPSGKVNAQGELQFTQGYAWSGTINWHELDLGYWQDAIDGQLSGAMQTELRYRDRALTASADISAFDGTINEQAVSGDGLLQWQNQRLQLTRTTLRAGGSEVSVDGSTDFTEADLTTRFSVPDLSHWLPELQGGLNGQLRLQGSIADPRIQGQVTAKQLDYQNILTDTITADVDWQAMDSLDNRIVIKAETVQQQDFFGNVDMDWQGSFADHRWRLRVRGLNGHEDKQLDTRCSGSWQPPSWSTQCDTVDLAFNYFESPQRWRLSAPLKLDLNTETQKLALSAFCLQNGEQRICNNEAVAIDGQNTGTVALQARNMSSQWLQPWLPVNLQLSGEWRANLALENPFQQQTLRADVDADNMTMRWQQGETAPLTVHLQTLSANWQWQPQAQQHAFDWRFITRDNGSSRGNLTLAGERIDGRLSLSQWQLAAFSRFLLSEPRDRIEGVVNSEFTLSGNLNQPLINGNMSIDQGAIRATVLPVPIQNIELDLAVTDNVAQLDGSFTANDSPGTLGGEFTWSPETWNANLSLRAENLAYQVDRNIRVHVSPDVQLRMTPELVTLTGDVRVPRADIEIEQLPEQAATVSADTVIVGRESQAQRQVVKTDLRLQLGENVNFEGFGLVTQITGNLRLQQNQGELLRGQGVLELEEPGQFERSRYRKYGQDLIIRNGDLVFVSDLENPQLRLEAIREPTKTADSVIVGLRASGSARQPNITLFSEPSMSQEKQMSYLLYGVAPGADRETDTSMLAAQQALSYALQSGAGESFTRFAGETLGIRDLQVTTDTDINQGTQIGLRGYLTPNLLVRYGVGVFDSVNSLTLQYQLRKNLYLEAVSGKGNALDLFWSFEKD